MRTTKKHLHIDIETFSAVDLKECGVYRYADDSTFEILLLAYAVGDKPVKVVDLAQGEQLPEGLIKAIQDQNIIKLAHNATFERVCLSKHLKTKLDASQWECTMIRAATMGMPHSLAEVAKSLELDEQKMVEGKKLINLFCKPQTDKQGKTYRVRPEDEPEKWEIFKEYCCQDVEVERAIEKKLESKPQTTEEEKKIYEIDQKINDKGALVEMRMVHNILAYYDDYNTRLTEEAQRISGIENPKSAVQAKKWLVSKGIEVVSLDKDAVKDLLSDKELPSEIKKFLKIKQELGKTSIMKYDAMKRAVCSDGRVHGMLQFYGAERTGRWAGRIVQLQNLPKNKISDLDLAREIVLENDFELLEMLYKAPLNICSQLIRTAFIAPDGYTFAVADYSAIEARVIAWLANEEWRQKVFASHGKIYEASASQMFHVPIETITKDSPLRAKGKVAELALGYNGGVGALKAMGAEEMGLTDDELQDIITAWRKASPNIVNFWKDVETSAKKAISNPGKIYTLRNLSFQMKEESLFVKLPSGREIAYYSAKLVQNPKRQGTEITYYGREKDTGKWQRISTYGGKMVENITQAVARDCLAWALIKMNEAEICPVFHVHDEVVVEVPEDDKDKNVAKITELMTLKEVEWIKGLKLTADAYTTKYYMKD